MTQGLQPIKGKGWLWVLGLTLIGIGLFVQVEKYSHQTNVNHKTPQTVVITIPADSLVIIDGVLARKNDIIKFCQIGTPREFFWVGRENAVRITTSIYYGKVWRGNDEGDREIQIWVKGGREGEVKLRIEVLPHS
jgi:hypothetical protein